MPELLEHILLHLDIETLFKIQRVDRTWHATINRSLHLQQHMFLAPVKPRYSWQVKIEVYDDWSPKVRAIRMPLAAEVETGRIPSCRINPLLFELFDTVDSTLMRRYLQGTEIVVLMPLFEKVSLKSSLSKMLVTQPPIDEVSVWNSTWGACLGYLGMPQGVNAGGLMQMLKAKERESPGSAYLQMIRVQFDD